MTAVAIWLIWAALLLLLAVVWRRYIADGLDCGCPDDGRRTLTCRLCGTRRCADHPIHCFLERTDA